MEKRKFLFVYNLFFSVSLSNGLLVDYVNQRSVQNLHV